MLNRLIHTAIHASEQQFVVIQPIPYINVACVPIDMKWRVLTIVGNKPDDKDPEGVESISKREYDMRLNQVAHRLLGTNPLPTRDPEGTLSTK